MKNTILALKKSAKWIVLAGTLVVMNFGCASKGKGPIQLKLRAEKGTEEIISYASKSVVNTTGSDNIERSKMESVDFKTKAVVTEIEPEKGILHHTVTVTDKNGHVDLHDMAFPELNEVIEISMTEDGEVLRAGQYPKNGIFFVPPISLPKEPVSIGDTWNLKKSWKSEKTGLEMELELLSIFKRIVKCGKVECADLEISGSVKLPGVSAKDLKLRSDLKGRILFAIQGGKVLWSQIRNFESIHMPESTVKVESCIESVLEKPAGLKFLDRKPVCEVPKEDGVVPPV